MNDISFAALRDDMYEDAYIMRTYLNENNMEL